MLVKRRVLIGENEIDNIFDNAASSGTDLIEVCWNKLRPSIAKVTGFEVPSVKYAADSDFSVNIETNVKWVEGVVKFYPDANNRCWGYIYDTETNREKIENCLATGWFFVVDKNIREEIISKADGKGKVTEHVENIVDIKKTAREIEVERSLNSMKYREEELKKKIRELETKIKSKSGEKADLANNRALHGVKIPNREEAKLKIEESKNVSKLADYVA
jgi:uncharacterized protein YwqG